MNTLTDEQLKEITRYVNERPLIWRMVPPKLMSLLENIVESNKRRSG